MVIEATFRYELDNSLPVVIEATSNQVNQFGGYTGMKPKDFVSYVYEIANEVGFPIERIILGGDHLGLIAGKTKPLTKRWKNPVS
ncbi:tagatose-6-phosphate kinase AgaZ [Vibrio maritimus]|uniref:Tagatose-6-phosphate kinase AgaZ n=1 Tax=Vibrio maritimus TaxID=990268 RepID=A0A090TWY6_9VIBR|nr:tagatose-6-phosphate kinase AgaZ [Vibrio maritimus]